MRRTLLWLLASLGLACTASSADTSPLKVMSAPNPLRVGTAENIFVECQDCGGQDPMDVRISAWNYPTKSIDLSVSNTTVTLNSANKFQAFGELVIRPEEPTVKKFVYLRAEFPGHTLEKVVLVSFQSGFLFIQTDKTLYTPDSTVNFRIFALTPDMKPIGRNETTGSLTSVAVEIMSPEGIVIPLEPVSLGSGMYTGTYQLGQIVSTGQWKVLSRLQSNPQQTYSAEFEVKKYVLPSFEVKLTSDSSFFYYDSQSFTVTVKATYLFGKEVDGMAYVVFGVMKDNIRKVFPASLQRIPILGGNGQATLQKDHILKTYLRTEELVGGSLFVTATVYTKSGSEMVEGEMKNMQIVTSSYFINFDKTSKYFKAGMSFDVTAEDATTSWIADEALQIKCETSNTVTRVQMIKIKKLFPVTVTNPDGTAAAGVPVVVEPGQNAAITTRANGRATVRLSTGTNDTSLTITARTSDKSLPANRQTSKSMVAIPHQSESQNLIHISVETEDVKLGTNFKVHLNLNNQSTQSEITYLILSRGQLVDFGRRLSEEQAKVALVVPVTKKMLPSFRLIVYYHPSPTEVASDSVWVDVDNSCLGTLTLEPKSPVLSYEPRTTFDLRVTADPGATVGLVAVDKGVYVLNKKHLLTQKKVWETVETVDTGCTPGGGEDSMGVFFDAGLMFHTDTAGGTFYRHEVNCSSLPDVVSALASTYKDPLEVECCRDGMKRTLLLYTCAQRKLYISDGKACEDAFMFCCEEMEKQRSELQQDKLILSRSEEDSSYMDTTEVTSRTQFPESWQWVTFKMPACAGNPHCPVNSHDLPILLKDSITTWVFTGISLSENNGICVGKPLDVVVFKEFFIDLRLPYSAVVGEQIEIRAVLHNYISDPITVRVELLENADVCSSASKRGKHRQVVEIAADSSRAVPFLIIPMRHGQLDIEVKAAARGLMRTDGVRKPLRVVPNGVLTKVNKIVELDPKGGTQEQTIKITIPKTEMVPNTPSSTSVFVTGREQVSRLVDHVMGASSMGAMIYQPTGCGEQNMYHLTRPVIATLYLDRTLQWEAVGLGKRAEALDHIRTGIRNEMTYAKTDGSFAIYPKMQSSTWLTAYVVKVFSMASNVVEVNNNVICNAVEFLILHTQRPDGVFTEIGSIAHRDLQGNVKGRDSDASMTAFCLIAMQEAQRICAPVVDSLHVAIAKSVDYLGMRLPNLTNPYAVAISSYALANADKLNMEILYNFVSPERTHWTSPQGHVFSLEATAYALLALVKAELLEDARPIVRWFTRQQQVGGGYGSTQATILVYQALSEYWAAAKEPDYSLDVELSVPGHAAPYSYRFSRDNQHTTRISQSFEVNESVRVTAKGTGEATVTLVTQFYAVPKEAVSDCAKFNLSVDFSLDKVDENDGDIYKLRTTFFFKNLEEDASMSVLDIALPTGFIHLHEDLNALSEGRAAPISQWEYNKDLSEKGSVILYLNKVAHNRTEELTFRMRQTHKVGVLQPASVSIYEYYDETKCVRYYHPQRKDGQILRRCIEEECLCAEENCSMQKRGHIRNEERLAKVCETTITSKIDFVYRVVLEDVDYDATFDAYAMRIERVIKNDSNICSVKEHGLSSGPEEKSVKRRNTAKPV